MFKKIGFSCLAALALTATTAQAQCIDAYMSDFDAHEAGQANKKSTFKVNELLVLCFKTRSAGFVSIFDTPKQGDFEQLYPNALTHDGGETYAKVEAGKLYCLGGRDTFPMYHPPDEGIGIGKISITLTRSASSQLDPDDYAIPGQKVKRNTMNLHLRSHARNQSSCSERDVKYLEYRVTN